MMTLLKVWQGDDGKWRWHYNGSEYNTGNVYNPCETREEAVADARRFVEEE